MGVSPLPIYVAIQMKARTGGEKEDVCDNDMSRSWRVNSRNKQGKKKRKRHSGQAKLLQGRPMWYYIGGIYNILFVVQQRFHQTSSSTASIDSIPAETPLKGSGPAATVL